MGAFPVPQVENLFVPNCRQPGATSAASLDIISMAPDSTVVLKDVVLHFTLCAPLDLSARFAPAVARPPVLPPANVPGNSMEQVREDRGLPVLAEVVGCGGQRGFTWEDRPPGSSRGAIVAVASATETRAHCGVMVRKCSGQGV